MTEHATYAGTDDNTCCRHVQDSTQYFGASVRELAGKTDNFLIETQVVCDHAFGAGLFVP